MPEHTTVEEPMNKEVESRTRQRVMVSLSGTLSTFSIFNVALDAPLVKTGVEII